MTIHPRPVDSNEPATKADLEHLAEKLLRERVNLERWLQAEMVAMERRIRREFNMPEEIASRAEKFEQLEDDVNSLDDELTDLRVDVDELKERISDLED